MTDLRKAAEMALEALEELKKDVTGKGAPKHWDAHYAKQMYALDALDALRQALAQDEQEPVCTKIEGNQFETFKVRYEDAVKLKDLPVGTKLYTAPPSKPWVSLTDKDITGVAHTEAKHPVSILETTDFGLCMQFSETGKWHASDKHGDFMKVNSFLMSFARAVEAALRSKNNG